MMNTLEKRLQAAIRKYPSKSDYEISRNYRGSSSSMVAALRTTMGEQFVSEDVPKGFFLSNLNVSSRKPSESAAKFIKRLPSNRGFMISQVAKEWGMSEETIKRHAKELGCFKYVELSEDEWVPLIMNPETAAQYS